MTKEIEKIIARFKKEVGKSKSMTTREMKLIEICIDELVVKNCNLQNVNGSFADLKIDDCWTACTRTKADKGFILNKSTEWNNAYQIGFEECFKWLKNYR